MSEVHKLSGFQISQKIKNQDISAQEYINLIFERINNIDTNINYIITKN
jgi:hypothetical protein